MHLFKDVRVVSLHLRLEIQRPFTTSSKGSVTDRRVGGDVLYQILCRKFGKGVIKMILHAPHLVLSLRWIPPCAVIIGCSPLYLVKWSAVKLLTFPLPRRAFVWLEDLLLSNYSALVGFFYETWSGVEVCMMIVRSIYFDYYNSLFLKHINEVLIPGSLLDFIFLLSL